MCEVGWLRRWGESGMKCGQDTDQNSLYGKNIFSIFKSVLHP